MFVQSTPTCTSNPAVVDWADIEAPTVRGLVCQIRQFKKLCSPLPTTGLCLSLDRLFPRVRPLEEKVENLPPCAYRPASRLSGACSTHRGPWAHTACHLVGFCLREDGEDTRKWDGAPTSVLEAHGQELWGKTVAKKGPSRKIAAAVAVEQFPRRSRWAEDTSPPPDPHPEAVCPRGAEPPAQYHGKTVRDRSRIVAVASPCVAAWARESPAPLGVKRVLVCNCRSRVTNALIRTGGPAPGWAEKGTEGFDGLAHQPHGNLRFGWTPVHSDT